MSKMWSNKIENILKIGKPLFNMGNNNWALTKQQALHVIDELYSLKVPIFGGDVLQLKDDTFQPSYDNWYCDPTPQESENNFLNRSISIAKNYVSSYALGDTDKIFFVLVPRNL